MDSRPTQPAPIDYPTVVREQTEMTVRCEDHVLATDRARKALAVVQKHFERLGLEDAALAANLELRELALRCTLRDNTYWQDDPRHNTLILTVLPLAHDAAAHRYPVELRFSATGANRGLLLRKRVLSAPGV